MKIFVLSCFLSLLLLGSIQAEGFKSNPEEARAHELMRLDPPDWYGARLAFQAAAEQGSLTAASYLGWIYEHGHGVDRDHAASAEWYSKVAEGGVAEYSVKLGWMYLGNSELAQNRERAEAYFKQAIAADYLPGNVALASILIADAVGGLGHERMDESRELLEEALEGGLPLAALFLARLYVEGIGGHPVDKLLGVRYTRISAEDGQPVMQGWLARMYLEGWGVEVDVLEAAFWSLLAAAGGDPLGTQIRDAVLPTLSDTERESVMLRSMHWAFERPVR